MRILKIIGIIFLILIALYIVACFLGSERVDVQRSTIIDAPAPIIYNQIVDVKKWEGWSPWIEADTSIQTTYGDKTVGVGASYSWIDGKGTTGNLEVIEAEKNTSLKTKIQFGNFPGFSYGEWTLNPTDTGTVVTWHMTSDTDVPFLARAFTINMDDMIGSDFEKGLSNIKKIAEAKAQPPYGYRGYTIELQEIPTRKFLAHREEIAISDIEGFYTEHLGKLMGTVARSGTELDGAPIGLYYTWDEENGRTDMAAAIGIKGDVEPTGQSQIVIIPAGKAAVVNYSGPYEGLGEAHMAIDDYLNDFSVEAKSPVIEEYVTDPMAEPDTSKWMTKIIYPLK
jgi:effector-binding domain-containing protein/ribosome-associated toxin RatA of RatAB toxin-antitoxin module